jgi:hypothetical protein
MAGLYSGLQLKLGDTAQPLVDHQGQLHSGQMDRQGGAADGPRMTVDQADGRITAAN